MYREFSIKVVSIREVSFSFRRRFSIYRSGVKLVLGVRVSKVFKFVYNEIFFGVFWVERRMV